MDLKEILTYVDHTILSPTAAWEQVQEVCEAGIKYNTASVCISPNYVKRCSESYGDRLNICTVIGFPLGYSTLESKEEETKQALLDGADEIDMVINVCDLKNGELHKIEHEIRHLKKLIGEDKILKVIIEACYLTESEKISMCEIVTNAKADYIKTSTGFGTGGATFEDILLFKKHIGGQVKIKAAGGIRTIQDMEKYIALGCSRLGTSAAVRMMEEKSKS
jgi:deoxyribose-phosphate aldolase